MKLDKFLNQQEVIERKVKELNDLTFQAVIDGAEIKLDTWVWEIDNNGVKHLTKILVDFKINPKDLK